jgi:hypothetical protein
MRHLVRSRREILERIAERETREEIGDLDISKPTLPDCSRRPATEHVNESARGKLIRWKHKLDSLGIGYGGGNYNMRVGMPFRITSDQFERLRRRGLLYAQMFDIANRLYAESLSNPSIVTKLVEGGMMPWGVEIQHALYEIKDPVRLPLFFRADMLSLEKTVELNIPGGGLSLMHSIDLVTLKRRTFGKGLAEGWAEGLR